MPKEEIPRGQLSNIILSTLLDNDKYGYEIIDIIKEQTNGNVVIKQPSLYSSLRRMEEQGLISSYWRDSEIGGRRHYYSITDYGKKYAEKWQRDLSVFSPNNNVIENIVEDTKNQEVKKEIILQQENLFSNNKKVKNQEQEERIEENHSFVQFDLFTSPTLISEPSNEVFDSIKKLRESADVKVNNSNDKIDNLSNLRNNNEEIKTSYVAENYNINRVNNIDDIKKNFFEISKKQKSFVDAVKDNEIPNEYNNNQNIELNVNNLNSSNFVNIEPTNDILEESTLNIEQILKNKEKTENVNNSEIPNKEVDLENKTYNDEFENNLVEQKPTIYQTTRYDEQEEEQIDSENFNSSSNVEFIDLNDIEYKNVQANDEDNTEDNEEKNNDNLANLNREYLNEELSVNDELLLESKQIHNAVSTPLSPNSNKDDAVLITDKPDFSNIPKVKKIAPARFENYSRNYVDSINNKLAAHYHKENEIYEKSDYEDNNKQNEEKQTTQYCNDLNSLKKYYSEFGLKFDLYQKHSNANKFNYVKVNKMKFISHLSISILIIIESIVLFCIFKHQQSSWNFLYLLLPAISLGLTSFYIIKFIKDKNAVTNKNNILNLNFMYRILMSIIFIMVIFSINLLCGMSLSDVQNYITTFIYPSIFILHYPLLNLANFILFKSNVINLK